MIMSFKMALRSIGSNKLRAVLTMLGIIIGVMALVVLVSIVDGATRSVTDQMSSLGSNYVEAYVWSDGRKSITLEDLNEWVESEPLIEAVAPDSQDSSMVKYGTKSQRMSIRGTTPAYYEICLTEKYVRDPESVEMLDLILSSVVMDNANIFSWGGVEDTVASSIYAGEGIASSLESKRKAAEKIMGKTIKAFIGE